MLEIRSAPGQSPWRLVIPLTAHWRALDELVEGLDPNIVAGLRDSGIDVESAQTMPDVVAVAVMIEPSKNNDHPPLMASLTVLDTQRPSDLPPMEGTTQEPVVRRDEYQIEWPGDVGPVRFHRATYLFATPNDDRAIVLAFASPNLPLADSIDVLFDAIVGRAKFFVEQEPISA